MKKIGLSIIIVAFIVFTSCKEEKKDSVEEIVKTEEVTEANTQTSEVESKEEETNSKSSENVLKNPERIEVIVRLESKSGSKASGKLIFKEVNNVVYMAAKFIGLSEGTHAIHIHEKADCSSPDGKSAGGHWNPTYQNHGKWGGDKEYHKGDIGNFEVDENGNGGMSMLTDEWCIGCGDEKKDILGKAIIVHQGTDDYVSQPSGAAGKRVSCGGIIQ